MEALSKRLLEEQIAKLGQAAGRKIQEDNLPNEDIARITQKHYRIMGIVRVGKLRAHWLLYEKPYRVFEEDILGLLADLLLALATMARVSGAEAVIIEDGRVEFKRARSHGDLLHHCFWQRASRENSPSRRSCKNAGRDISKLPPPL